LRHPSASALTVLTALTAFTACTPGEGPDPAAVAALEAFVLAPDGAGAPDLALSLPDPDLGTAGLGELASGVDGHHDLVRAWVDYDGEPHWIFAQVDATPEVAWAVVIAPAPDDVRTADVDPVGTYTDAWNRQQPARALRTVWAEGGRYVDPTTEGHGLDEVADVIDDFNGHFSRTDIVPDSGVRAQDDALHFRWRMQGGLPRTVGMDIARINELGELTLVAGFFGELKRDR
jgi:hypothetical protein